MLPYSQAGHLFPIFLSAPGVKQLLAFETVIPPHLTITITITITAFCFPNGNNPTIYRQNYLDFQVCLQFHLDFL